MQFLMQKMVIIMIKINNITKKYGSFVALDNVSFNINEKECFTLLGFNGAGKTTLINILSTTLKQTSGSVYIKGLDISKNSYEIKNIINISPQETAVAKNLTVRENLNFIADLYEIDKKEEKVEKIISEFNLEDKSEVLAKKLSGGQLKRLSLALAVITEPEILFLDEPTLGLDILARKNLWNIIKKLKNKITILLTTHYLEEVEELTDRVAILCKGKIKAIGTIKEILKETNTKSLEEAFLSVSEE